MATHPEHPFAAFLKIVGKGPNLSRPLAREEARDAMSMIIAGDVEPEQLGAFLLLLRYRGEVAEELAGFVDAARDSLRIDPDRVPPDIDWPSYADRHRQQPWFILSALLLAENGFRVFMHGIAGEQDGYAPTRPVLRALGVAPSADITSAMSAMEQANFAYMGLETFLPRIEALFHLRPTLGLRTVVNTFARAINPLRAPCQMQGVVHPDYRTLHQDATVILEQPGAAVFKGGGGEVQRNPLKACQVFWRRDGATGEEEWPPLLHDVTHDWRGEDLDPARIVAVWRGELDVPAAAAAIIGTAAIALHTLGHAATMAIADDMAAAMWQDRPRDRF